MIVSSSVRTGTMSKRYGIVCGVLLAGLVALVWMLLGPRVGSAADSKETPAKGRAPEAAVFGVTRVHELHLGFTAKEWERLQMVIGGMRFPGAPGNAAKPAEKPPEKPGEEPIERHKNGGFGNEFPWAHADLSEGDTIFKNVGVRYKGNASYMASARGLKRNFKIALDHYDDELRYHGLKTLNLNAGAMDATKLREVLSYAVFRAAGVPAPRTAFAVVTLTVPGKYDQELLGLYTLVEQVDKTFLKDRFKNNKGMLLKPERVRGLEYLGDDWERYKDRYQPKHEPTKDEARRLMDFTRLVNRGTDEQFAKEINAYLDVDEFLRYLAGNALLVNLDSFLTIGHNYYLYLNPQTNKFVFIPWDLDLSLAGFPMAGPPTQQTDLSLMHPHAGANKLIDRLLALPEVNAQYQKLLKELAAGCFAKETLLKELDALEKVTKEPLAREKKAAEARKENQGGFGPPGGGMFGQRMDLRTFVEKRTESIVAQLDGKSKGYVPSVGFGPGGPGGPGGRPRMFGIGSVLARPLIDALDTDKDGKLSKEEFLAGARQFFKDCDKDRTGTIDEKALADRLNRMLPPPPGFGGPGAPGGAGNFGPGTMLAGVIARRANAKEGKITQDNLLAAAEALFAECDKDKKGKLDETAVAAGMNALLPPPPFGPPGGGPPGRRPEPPRQDDK